MEFPSFNSFNFQSIKGFDPNALKSINLEDVKDWIKQKKFEVLAGIIFLVALVVVGYIFNTTGTVAVGLDDEKRSLQEKLDPIKKYKQAVANQASFIESLPPALGPDNFITVLTEIAKKRGVRITDFTPPVVQEDRYYRKLISKFSCSAPGFREAILFINDLEKATYAIKLESWTLHPPQSKSSRGGSDGGNNAALQAFAMDLTVSSTKIEIDSKVKPVKNEQ